MDIDINMYRTNELTFETDRESIETAVKTLAEEYFGTPAASISYAGGGSCGIVYMADRDDGNRVVIKLFRVEGMHRIQELETRMLAAHCPLPMPKTLFIHDPDEAVPWGALGMEFVPGVPCVEIDPNTKTKAEKLRLAEIVTDAQHAIHCAKNDVYGFVKQPEFQSWTDYYKPYAKNLHDWLMENGGDPVHKIPKEMMDMVDRSWNLFDRIFAEPIPGPSLIHGDLCVCNMMVDEETMLPTAFIDPWNTMWADRDYDLHSLYNITGREFYFYETYKRKFEVSETCDLKCAFYALYNEIYCYLVSGLSFEYIYPRMIENLTGQIKKYLGE